MTISEDKLVGWLCVMRLNSMPAVISVPKAVRVQMIERGWINELRAATGQTYVQVTDIGAYVTDLAAPEWGIDPLRGNCLDGHTDSETPYGSP